MIIAGDTLCSYKSAQCVLANIPYRYFLSRPVMPAELYRSAEVCVLITRRMLIYTLYY